ncbi:hypothetical protein BOX15_Mlig023392g2, partial [Macrostomum lignano]
QSSGNSTKPQLFYGLYDCNFKGFQWINFLRLNIMQSSKSNHGSLNPRKFDEKIALLQAGEDESNEKFNRLLNELSVLKNRLSTGDPARRTVSTPNVSGGARSGGASPAPSGVYPAAAAPDSAAAPSTPIGQCGLSDSSSSLAVGLQQQPNPLTLSPQHQPNYSNSPVSSPTHAASAYAASPTGYALSPASALYQQQHSSSAKHRVREYIISKSRDHRPHPYSPTHRSRDEYDEQHFGGGGVGGGGLGPPLGPRRASSDTNIAEKLQQPGFADFYYGAVGSDGQQFQVQQQLPPQPIAVSMTSPLLQQQLLLLQQQQQQQQQQQPVMLQSDMTKLSLANQPVQSVNQQPSLVAALLTAPGSSNCHSNSNNSGQNYRSSWHHYQMTQSDEDLSGLAASSPSAQPPQQVAPGQLVLPQSPTGPIPDIRVTPISQAAAMPPPPPPMQQPPPLTTVSMTAYANPDLTQQHLDNSCGVRRDSYTMATEVLASLATAAPPAGLDSKMNGDQGGGFTF